MTMVGKWCDEGENYLLDVFFTGEPQPGTLYLGLYTDPSTEPSESAVLSGLTEPSGADYARQSIASGDWTLSGAQATGPQKTFTASLGAWGNCYGYFLTTVLSGTSGKLLAVENFSDGPYNVPSGGSIKVTPKFTAS
jgi:hypothetical protein